LNKEIDSLDRLKETEVSNLLSHLLHTIPLTPEVSRENYPSINYFSQPKANLLFIFNSLYGINEIEGSQILVTPESYPGGSLSKVNTILTGRTPNAHAIVSETWFDLINEKPVTAYSTWNPAISGGAVASFHDLAALTTQKGETPVPILFSISSSLSLARSLSPKQFVLAPAGLNTTETLPTGLYWDESVFESVYDDEGNSGLGRLVRKLMTRENIRRLATEKFGVNFGENGKFMWKNANGVEIEFDGKNDFNAVVEMAMVEIFAENAEELLGEKIKQKKK